MSTANSAEAKKEFSQKYSGKLILNGFINKQEEARRDYKEKKGKYLRINETRSTNEFICVISRRCRARAASELKQPEKSSQHFIGSARDIQPISLWL